MKSICRALLLTSLLALVMGALSADAMAGTLEWRTYSPEWGQKGVAIKETTATLWKGTIKLNDAGTENDIQCEESAEGSVEPGGTGTVAAMKVAKCTLIKGGHCEAVLAAKAVGLPWHAELAASGAGESIVRQIRLTKDGHGEPGFKFECQVGHFGRDEDECTATTLTTNLANNSTGIEANFSGGPLNCYLGGAREGSLEGTQTIEAASGPKLETISGPFKSVSSALAVKATGVFRMEDTALKAGAECEVESAGNVEAHGAGTITSFTSTSCKPVGGCSSLRNYKPAGLPWQTSLGELGEMGVSAKEGAATWQFECEQPYVFTVRCNLPNFWLVNNGDGEVLEYLSNEKEDTLCYSGGHTGVWSGHLTLLPPTGYEGIEVS